MNVKSVAAVAAAAIIACASAASCATLVVDTTPDLSLYGLNSAVSDVTVLSGNRFEIYASPFGTGSQSYYSVGSPGFTPSPATLRLAAASTSFGLLWGSIDPYNAVEFLFDDGLTQTVVDLVRGSEIRRGTGGIVSSGIDITTLASFNVVRFYSNFGVIGDRAAFEFATKLPAAVPLPAAWLLLLGAIAGLVGLRRRKAA